MNDNFFSDKITIDLTTGNESRVKRLRFTPPNIDISLISKCTVSSKKHICIGHAFANVYGELMDDIGEDETDVMDEESSDAEGDDEMEEDDDMEDDESPVGPISIILNSILSPSTTTTTDNGLTEIPMKSIESHATTIYTYRSNVNYIWYVNPWGFGGDYDKFEEIEKRASCFLIDEYIKPSPKLSIEDSLKVSLPLGLTSPETEFCFRAHMIWYASSEVSRIDAIRWNSRFTTNEIQKGHPTTMLFMMTYERRLVKDIIVIHPMQSMNMIGPQIQTSDGLDTSNIVCRKLLDDDVVGACVPWTTIYGVVIDKLFDQLPIRENNHNLVMRILRIVKDQALCGEKNAKYLLGKIMFHEKVKPYQADFLGEVYSEIPELDGDMLKNIYMREVARNYDIFQEKESLEEFLVGIGVKSVLPHIGDFLVKYEDDGGQSAQLVSIVMLLIHCKMSSLD